MSVPELNKLSRSIANEIERKHVQLRKEAIKHIEALAKENGIELSAFFPELYRRPVVQPKRPAGKRAAVKGGKKKGLPGKYAHPTSSTITWSGHGRRPQWVLDWLAAGKDIQQLAIR